MSAALTIRPLVPHEWQTYRALRLRSLSDSPDAFGSTLEEEKGRSGEEWARRLTCADDPRWNLALVAESEGEAVGLAWGHIDTVIPHVANLYQMWVAPDHRQRGVGRMLLEAVIAWARAREADCLELDVACGDNPARRLYARLGFEPVGDPRPLRPGSILLGQPMRLKLRS